MSRAAAKAARLGISTCSFVPRRRLLFDHLADVRLFTRIAFAPHMQPISLSQAFSGWSSQTHPMP
jgi:hypothetical protein